MPMDDAQFDALLGAAFAPPERPADTAFVARVEREVAEFERYRRWRAALARRLVSEGLAAAALAGSLIFLAQVPELRAMLVQAPGLAWPAVLALLLFWMLIVRGRPARLA
jgi:sterol desaturase/sphingolipid hydroxylase (fatty acid hydroxylase superfamily)